MSSEADIRACARAFIQDVFVALTNEHVIPTPVFHPYIAVGRDYFGDSIRGLQTYRELEKLLEGAFPHRFRAPLERRHSEFASRYLFGLVEASVARCGLAHDFHPTGPPVADSIEELLTVLESPRYELVCIRHVGHLTTVDQKELEFAGVTVVPEAEPWHSLADRIEHEIAGAAAAWNRNEPRPFEPPHALLIVREATDDPDVEGTTARLSSRLDRFLQVARLLTGGTARASYEVAGASTRISRMGPILQQYPVGFFDRPLRRTVRVNGEQAQAFVALSEALDAADVKREGMAATSFDLALAMFNRSHAVGSELEHLVDLAAGLEAALIGSKSVSESVTFRLRNRGSALLSCPSDPARALFKDIGALYDLRSKFVHGGQVREADLDRLIKKLSTTPADQENRASWTGLGYAVDRLRDILRRAILARLCLAREPDRLWPHENDAGVDEALADDEQRALWRDEWRHRMESFGAADACDPSAMAVWSMSQQDR